MNRPPSRPRPSYVLAHGSRRAPLVVIVLATAIASLAAVPPLPAAVGAPELADEPNPWRQSFLARFNARLSPSLEPTPGLGERVAEVWRRLRAKLSGSPSEEDLALQQYPVLRFVDDRFFVMRYRTPEGDDTFVVGPEEDEGLPTLSSTLADFLSREVYPTLVGIGREEEERVRQYEGYRPDLSQLRELNPYQSGVAIRVPDLGPFQNRVVAFSRPTGRLAAEALEDYEARKWEAPGARVTRVGRRSPWGLAVEQADLVRDGRSVCRYRTIREIAAVRDERFGEEDHLALLRTPVLGPVIEVAGCLSDCERPESWTRIYPHPDDVRRDGPPKPRFPRVPISAERADPDPMLPPG